MGAYRVAGLWLVPRVLGGRKASFSHGRTPATGGVPFRFDPLRDGELQ